MDGDDLRLEETARALDDLRRTNRRLMGYLPVIRSLLPHLEDGQTVLDVGSGSGDVAEALRNGAARRGKDLRLIAVDFKLRHLLLGRRSSPDQLRVVASAEALPFARGSVDWSFSSLFFHHFGSDQNRQIVGEMRRVSRRGAVVVDLRRSILLRWLIRPLLRLVSRVGPVAAADGLTSVRASWSMEEVQSHFCREAGVRLRRRFPFRFVLHLPTAAPDLDLEK